MSCSMKWKMATKRTTKINRAATSLRHDLEHYCRDLSGWPLVDGAGKRPAAGRAVGGPVPPLSRTSGRIRSIDEDHPETCRQHVGAGRRVHSPPPQRSFSEKEAPGPDPPPDDRVRRPAPLSRRLRGSAEIFCPY